LNIPPFVSPGNALEHQNWLHQSMSEPQVVDFTGTDQGLMLLCNQLKSVTAE